MSALCRAVYIDDEAIEHRMMNESLKRCVIVFDLKCFIKVQDAYDYLEHATDIDFIFIDFMMDRITGDKVLVELLKMDNLKRAKKIMVTGMESPEIIKKCYTLDCDGYIVKPIKSHQIDLLVDHHIRFMHI